MCEITTENLIKQQGGVFSDLSVGSPEYIPFFPPLSKHEPFKYLIPCCSFFVWPRQCDLFHPLLTFSTQARLKNYGAVATPNGYK